ncbi:MAG: rod shape-determining protein MreC [Nocardioides sp.]|uniref:rod shape-determining protein MreC n=1 Tax=Nocardioides sp. TaxID=35761 RepID=UPI003EFBAFC4
MPGLRNEGRERRWSGTERLEGRGRPSRSVLVALVLASVTLITLDVATDDSPLDPARRAVGEVLGPVQTGSATLARPFEAVAGWFTSRGDLRDRVEELEGENADLREQVVRTDFDRNRLDQYDSLTRTAEELGTALVPARVVAVGPAQSFDRTVTIDAGSEAGIGPDMTVVSSDGLVGRVLRVTSTTATVLLVVDRDSTVGGRVGSSMEIGFVTGNGSFGGDAGLDLRLVDATEVPARDDVVLTWGSDTGPYEAGVPIGRVTEVYSSLRETSQRAVVEPFVNFSTLDVVAVMVPSGTASDRAVIEADGSLR